MRKVIFTALLVSSLAAFSQTYKSSIGAKLGYGLLGSYKYVFSKPHAVDVFAGFAWYGGGFVAGASYQYHINIPDVKGLSVPLGAGAMFGAYSGGWKSIGGPLFAITGNVGIEYAFSDIPLSLGLEYMPAFGFGGHNFIPGFGTLNVRYILGRK